MEPPEILKIEYKGGFTRLCRGKTFRLVDGKWRTEHNAETGDTMWTPATKLKRVIGELVEFDENSFFQLNDDCTKAIYKIKGDRYRVVAWFRNDTGERIA